MKNNLDTLNTNKLISEYDIQSSYMKVKGAKVLSKNKHFITESNFDKSNTIEESSYIQQSQASESKSSKVLSIKQLSNCQTCLRIFNSNENLPLLLSCGHFFCKGCILSRKSF